MHILYLINMEFCYLREREVMYTLTGSTFVFGRSISQREDSETEYPKIILLVGPYSLCIVGTDEFLSLPWYFYLNLVSHGWSL